MLENCRWLLYASRVYGCHPHTIREDDSTPATAATRFRPLMLYSVVACGVYCAAAYHASSLLECVSAGAMIVGCAVQQVDRYTRSLFMILTTVLSCLCHLDFERAVASARKFDDLTRHYRRRADVNSGPPVNRRVQWLVLFGVHLVWALYGVHVRYAMDDKIGWHTIAIMSFMRAAFSTEVAKFCFLYDALRRRFRLVNQLCCGSSDAATSSSHQRVTVSTDKRCSNYHVRRVTVGVNAPEELTILHLQRLHRCLTDATKYLSSHYSPQLLCWLACLLMDILMYIFFAVYTVNRARTVILQCVILVYLSVQIIAASRVCHLTCDQANALARIVLSMGTSAFRRNEFFTEAIELGVYLRIQPLRIRVFGLFNMDNRFPFSVFGVILMYVILASSLH
ncbi:uncharacterized protein LOC116840931 [Odontomachus brunneus]|uniref:uncharacterized protein LOC116840931 n=1 Tax=Odontomachus brunneus TaxID=486640 RepID=UPI0013F190E7|nr:uncharacterized protein LOC116840931 [Odontomachus brunneus]